jgi:putative DNA primase/helicase
MIFWEEKMTDETATITPVTLYTPEEKDFLIKQQIIRLRSGEIKPEFSYKIIKEEDHPEVETFKKYLERYNAGELDEEELKIYDGDWLLALKEKDRKKSGDFISKEGWTLRRNEIAVIQNRPLTDFGNAERLVDQYGQLIRFCPPMKSWYIWMNDEGRWKLDEIGYINRIGKDVTRRICYEATRANIDDIKKKIFSWGIQCECKTHLSGMTELAQHEKTVLVLPDDFDKDDMLFNLKNGTFNLKTLVLQPHDKENNLSKLSDFDYNPKATCPLFIKYLDRIFINDPNKKEIVSFLKRAVGYTLTGLTQEQCLFLLYGAGANGKSVFLEVLLALLGEYGTTTQSKTFTTDRGEISNDIAALAGRRFVCASENASDTKIDESIVKQLTGGEKVSARFLHKEFFSYKPRFKLWWGFNHPPAISDMTNSIWRRIKIIPFTEVLPENEWDKQLAFKIIRSELPGIFNWAVEGLGEYNEHGLQQPEIITKATRSYKNDQDILLDFFTTNYEFTESENDMVKATDLFTAYKTWWLNIESTKPMTSTMFGRLCRDRGLVKIDKREGHFYQKIRSIHQNFIQK